MSRKQIPIEEQAALFRVLADPTRLRILKLLSAHMQPDALCVNALAHRLGITQSAVSQHLRILKAADMVKSDKRGYRVHYFVNKKMLSHYFEIAKTVLGADTID